MAYRVWLFVLCFAFVACGHDNKNKSDAPTGADGAADTNGGDGAGTDSPGMTGDAAVGAVCGSMQCGSNQECCTGGGSGDMCVATGTCQTVAFGCDGPEDCPGQVCCYGMGSGSAGTGGSECKNANQCQTSACHVDGDCTEAGAMKCCQIGMTPYNICLAACPP